VDESDNVWSANFYASTVGLVSAGGSVVSGTAGYSGGGINHPQGIAVDSKGKAWIANFRGPALTELAAAGTKSAGQILSPASGWAPDSGIIEAFGLAIDPSGNIWVTDFGQNALTEYVGLAAPVKTPLLGPVQVP
jgi:sugar lactone lactonase YvrE